MPFKKYSVTMHRSISSRPAFLTPIRLLDGAAARPRSRFRRSVACLWTSLVVVYSLLAFSLFVAVDSARACTCEPKPDVSQALDDASLVFVGRVVSKSVNPFRPEEQEVKFTVTRKLKGFDEIGANTVLVYTPRDHEYCGYKFGEGLDYLVFAVGSPAHFKTTSCTRTEVLENALTDVQKLIRMTGAALPPK